MVGKFTLFLIIITEPFALIIFQILNQAFVWNVDEIIYVYKISRFFVGLFTFVITTTVIYI